MSLLAVAAQTDTRANARITVYHDGTVDKAMCTSRAIFARPGWIARHDDLIAKLPWDAYCSACHGHVPQRLIEHKSTAVKDTAAKDKNIAHSKNRAKAQLYDYIRDNSCLDTFCTLTLDKKYCDRKDADALAARLQTYLSNRVRRENLHYVAVYEYHKDGALHVHMLCNHDALKLTPARNWKTGRLVKHKGKDGRWHQIYNISDWRFGFTTAERCYGFRHAIANYVSKYISKSELKIRGRWYMHSHNLTLPEHRYFTVDYSAVTGKLYTVPERSARLEIKYTTPEQIAQHIDVERDWNTIYSTFVRQGISLDRAPKEQSSSAAGDLELTLREIDGTRTETAASFAT